MRAEIIGGRGSWRIVIPATRVIDAHLALYRPGRQDAVLTPDVGRDMIEAYRAATAALQAEFGSAGFMITFAVNWQPDHDAIGEPDSIADAGCAVHIFGRRAGEMISPVRAMTLQRSRRRPPAPDPKLGDRLRPLLADPPATVIVEPPPGELCDGCAGSVLTDQERWRGGGVRVIRPRRVLIDPHVLVLPVRHVASLRDLEPDEVTSLSARLVESLRQFRLGSGSTGLSGFANDGVAARQETPHVHLHVYGRSVGEPVNPYQRLAAYLPPGAQRPV